MSSRHLPALVALVIGLALSIQMVLFEADFDALSMVVAAAAGPVAIVLWASARLEVRPSVGAAVGGAILGVLVALVGHMVVFAGASQLLRGFGDAMTDLFNALRLDPALTAAATSPWILATFVHAVLLAPLFEEVGKGLGGVRMAGPTRQTAFMAGASAGAGFAITENVVFAMGGSFFGPAWEPVVLARMLGVVVHPLASGLVVLGWWEWRRLQRGQSLTRNFVMGVGIHTLWNGSVIALLVVSRAYDGLSTPGWMTIAYMVALGATLAGVMWLTMTRLVEEAPSEAVFGVSDGPSLAAWTVLTSSFVLPVAMGLLTFGDFLG